ncbi:hypothetical protein Ahy_B06g083933 [Arachis hypogaea]|uniref:Disease resistance protein n=1 Tax=Arachis hypogaea TaxID=3818 RepID=A0A444YQM6_ARAHY|nr:hypothetical protein Ahy_B06g083933 [Arachis hypogaea]
MAESFIFNVAQSLIGKLTSPAYKAATQLIGVYDDLQDFKHTLSYVKAVLLDAEQKQEQNHALREWLKQIKRVFSDAEIVLDELECEILRKQVVKAYGTTKHKVGRFFSSSNSLVFRYKMSKKLEEIRKRLDLVAADRNKFGLERIDADRRVVHRREMTYSHVVESNAIGRDFDKEKIIKLLLQENPHISVIPIVGIGGMGKTTLAKLVYNDQRITESFPLKMWICVSDDFDFNQLLIKIIMCTSEGDLASSYSPVGQQNVKDLDVQQLQHTLRKKIAGKKFLLILDDVWNDDRVKWLELRDLLEMMGSNKKSATLRTILFPVHEIGVDEAFLNTSVLKHKYLYMLDLSNSTYETLPWFIHKLKHLRFLDLQYNRKVKRLPDSICMLQCLQTFLLVGCTELEVLPRGLEKLISLRRLEITTKQISLPEKEIANLKFLQRLHISFSENLESLFLGIKLPTLKTLIVGKCSNLKFLTIDPKHFPQLEYIHINGCDKLEFPEEYDCGTKDSNMRLKLLHPYEGNLEIDLDDMLHNSISYVESELAMYTILQTILCNQ